MCESRLAGPTKSNSKSPGAASAAPILHVYHDNFRSFPPVILGHEMGATIVEVGKNVRGLTPGERFCVLGASAVTCGRCLYCRQGQFMFCAERRGMGHGVNGAFTRYVVVRPDQLFRLPAGSAARRRGRVRALRCRSPRRLRSHPTHGLAIVALISGPGPIGLLCLKLLAAEGIKTIVAGTEADLWRLGLAKRIGACAVVNVDREDLQSIVRERTGGLGADVVMECAGAAPSVGVVWTPSARLGHYTQVGHFGKEVTAPLDHIAFKQIRIAGSVGYTVATWLRMLKILEQGKVRLGDIITHKLAARRMAEGLRRVRRQIRFEGPAPTLGPMRLKDKTVLITGASKGIGRALALGMAREGANVILNYNSDRAGAEAVAGTIRDLGRRTLVVKADIAKVSQIQRMFAKARKTFGRLDVLVNNAGITGWTSLFELTEENGTA